MSAHERASLEDAVRIIESEVKLVNWEYSPVGPGLVSRVLAEDVYAPVDVPPHNVCSKDGFLVRFDEAAGMKKLRVSAGYGPGDRVPEPPRGCCFRVSTGSLVESDDVSLAPLEEVEDSGGSVTLTRGYERLENITPRGADISKGELVLKRGRRIKPFDVELMRMMGYDHVRVFRKPSVGLLSVGSEITLNPRVDGGRAETTRFLSLSSMVKALGGEPVNLGVVPDDEDEITKAILDNAASVDVVLTIGGTGLGPLDQTIKALGRAEGARPLFNGLEVRGASRVSAFRVGGLLVVTLPGPPQAAINGFVLIAARAICRMMSTRTPSLRVTAFLDRDLPGGGRGASYITWVKLSYDDAGRLLATPLLHSHTSIGPYLRASGYLIARGGLKAGDRVVVTLPLYLSEYIDEE